MAVILLSGAAGPASAHTPGSEAGLLDQLGHQLFGLHHWPLTLLLLAAGCLILLRCYKIMQD